MSASLLSRARWAVLVAVAAGTATLMLGPALVRHIVGAGDCTGLWKLAGAQIDPNGNLVVDPGLCPLTGLQTTAVWMTAVAMGLIAAITTFRLLRR